MLIIAEGFLWQGSGRATSGMLIVIFFLFAASSFTAATFAYFLHGDVWIAQIGTLAIPAAFLGTIFWSFRPHPRWVQWAGKITSIAMGFLNFAFLAALLCWPAVGLLKLGGRPELREETAAALLIFSVPVALYGLLNAARLRVTRYTVRLPDLPPGWQGREVALVSDIHVGVIRGAEFVRRIIALLEQLRPHAVLLPGDMFDGAKVDIAGAVAPWSSFRVPAGVYFVTGNHDEFSDPAPYVTALRQAGVIVLHNEKREVDGLQILGVEDPVMHDSGRYRELLDRLAIDRGRPSVLLAHRPAHVEVPAAAGVSLQVSGHTHAGQFPLFSQLVSHLYGRLAYGLNRVGSLQVVTSSGAGTGGPPFRIGTRSEIVLIRLERESAGHH